MSNLSQFDAYVIEVGGEAVGLVARDGRGFLFHASVPGLRMLDHRRFATPGDAERAAAAVMATPAGAERRARTLPI